ncbi:MAG TPA: hypothetical protein VK929_03140 [Longimicrobiales bacterium]|nr:hypothetical protein [Longimicrobiales bacterium]
MPSVRGGFALWAGALALALAFLAVDSAHRLRSIGLLSTLRITDAPAPAADPMSPTGYEARQHRLVLPPAGTDGYHWIMQTERMLAGDGLRIRHSEVDNAPDGREVHWSSPLRWWLGGLALVRKATHPHLTHARALEQVAPAAGAMLLAALLLILTPLIARWFGAPAAAVFVLAWVGVFPLYEAFMVGIVDHHGMLAVCCFLGLVLPVRGGSGWLEDGRSPHRVRRWFAVAGVVSGVGLWISAAVMLPVIIATGVAGVLAAALTRPEAPGGAGPRRALMPDLWRVWGVAGAATAFTAWLVEYFPGDMGMRLEVNHPLYALAWIAGADLTSRLAGWLGESRTKAVPGAGGGGEDGPPGFRDFLRRHGRWVLPELGVLLAVPGIVLATGAATFGLADPFLRGLHHQFIAEFQTLPSHLTGASALHIVQGTGLLPLALLPLAALVLKASGSRAGMRVLGSAMVLAGLAFVHALAVPVAAGLVPGSRTLVHLAALAITAATFCLLFLLPYRRIVVSTAAPRPGPALVAGTILTVVPALVLLALSFAQVRWIGSAAAATLALLVTMAQGWAQASGNGRRAVTVLLIAMLVPFPLLTAAFPWRHGYAGPDDAPQLAVRDAAYTLRHHAGGRDAVVLSGPTTTSWLIWFGGFRGVGTLYWENVEGLRAAADLFRTESAEELRLRLRRLNVSYIVAPSWDPFAASFALPPGADSYILPLEFMTPVVAALRGTSLRLYEVRHEDPPRE